MNMREMKSLNGNSLTFIEEEKYEEKIEHLVRPILKSNKISGYFNSFDEKRIYYECIIHPHPKAAIVISHGFCEFTAKFEEVIFYFFQAGYSVFIFDYRGHGYSERLLEDKCMVHVSTYEEYVHDLNSFVTKIVQIKSPNQKLVLFGHSMGGTIAALYLEHFSKVFTCGILSTPMLQINMGILPVSMVELILQIMRLLGKNKAYVFGHRAFDGVSNFETSSCISKARYDHIFNKRLQDENYQTYGASNGWTLASIRAIRKLHRNARRIITPILLFQAKKDTTVKPEGQIRFAKNTINTQLVIVPDSKHEIYNGSTKMIEDYFSKILEFLNEILK